VIIDDEGRPMVAVLTCQGDTEINVARSYLESFGIEAKVNAEIPPEVLPLNVAGLGETQLLVAEHVADQARSILEARLAEVLEQSRD